MGSPTFLAELLIARTTAGLSSKIVPEVMVPGAFLLIFPNKAHKGRRDGALWKWSAQRNVAEGESDCHARKQGRGIKRIIHGENVSLDHVFVMFYVIQDVYTLASATRAAARAESAVAASVIINTAASTAGINTATTTINQVNATKSYSRFMPHSSPVPLCLENGSGGKIYGNPSLAHRFAMTGHRSLGVPVAQAVSGVAPATFCSGACG